MVIPLINRKLITTYISPERSGIYPDLMDKRGYWTAWYMAAFWMTWGLIWIVRYSNTERRAAHLAYWTEKKS